MKKHLFSLIFLFFCFFIKANTIDFEEDDPNIVMAEMQAEIKTTLAFYWIQKEKIHLRIETINKELLKEIPLDQKVDLLIEKDNLRVEKKKIIDTEYTQISKIRYIKGLHIIKLLYEKILSLDHHFSSVYTFSEINKISNPNTYPEFSQVKDLVLRKKKKKLDFDLGSILGENPLIAATQTFIGLLDFDFSSNKTKEELYNIECIIDFTLSMQNELNTIYFETTYLQSGNESLKNEIEILFRGYTQPIEYEKELVECRAKDDWNSLRRKLDSFLKEIETSQGRDQFIKQVNLEFPIDRLLQFITSYNNFIDQGEQFYRKFKIILNSYESSVQCQTSLPIEYTKLKNDIDVAIEKFQIAYKPVEVNGSKMKEILYGLNDFE